MQKKYAPILTVGFLTSFIAIKALANTESTTASWLPKTGRVLASGAVASDVKTLGGDGMLPVYGHADNFAYADFMGDYGTDDTYLISPGLGYRTVLNNQIVGGYFFGDYERTSLGANFWVLSPGIEWMNTHWDAHVNGYFPTETQEQTGNTVFQSTIGNYDSVAFVEGTHDQYDMLVAPYAVIGNGIDAEVGYGFAELSGLRSRVYVGGYYYGATNSYEDLKDITGVTAGFEQPISKNLSLSLFNSYDNVNDYVVGVSLTATFGQDSTVFSNNINDRLLDPVERHVGIINTGAGNYDQRGYEDAGMALQYNDVYFMEPTENVDLMATTSTTTPDGTYGNPMQLTQDSLDQINTESADGAHIYLQGGENAVYQVNASTATGEGVTDNEGSIYTGLEVYDGQDFYGKTADYTGLATGSDIPEIQADGANGYSGFITQGGENTFNSLSITEYSTSNTNVSPTSNAGIVAINNGDNNLTLNIDGIDITGMDAYGLYVENNDAGTMNINANAAQFNGNGIYNSDSGSANAYGFGMYAENNSTGTMNINAEAAQFNGNGIYNSDSGSANAYGFGMYAENNSTGTMNINAEAAQFNGNGIANSDTGSANAYGYGMAAANYSTGTMNINTEAAQFNGNGIANSSDTGVANAYGFGMVAENNSTGTIKINAEAAQFNGNGIANSYDTGSAFARGYGMYAANYSTGTMTINLKNATFENNTSYGIYGSSETDNTTNIDYTGANFSGNGAETNQTTEDRINWTP